MQQRAETVDRKGVQPTSPIDPTSQAPARPRHVHDRLAPLTLFWDLDAELRFGRAAWLITAMVFGLAVANCGLWVLGVLF